MNPIFSLIFIALSSYSFSQNGYLKKKQLFLGADSIEGKRIIAGMYLISTDSLTVRMDLSILDNWMQKDSITELLTLDQSSLRQPLFMISHPSDTIPAYRYVNEHGFELYLAKEHCFESHHQDGVKNNVSCQYTLAQVYLPEYQKFYVHSLPLMYHK